MMKLNLILIWALQFLHQFKFDIYYKPEKEYIIPDALSHLERQ